MIIQIGWHAQWAGGMAWHCMIGESARWRPRYSCWPGGTPGAHSAEQMQLSPAPQQLQAQLATTLTNLPELRYCIMPLHTNMWTGVQAVSICQC
jgi:hypothetical protein